MQILHEGVEKLLLDIVDEDFGELRARIRDRGMDCGVPFMLDPGEESLGQQLARIGADLGGALQLHPQGRERKLFLPRELSELDDQGANVGYGLLRDFYGSEHLLLGGLLGMALDHGDALRGSGYDDLKLGLLDLIMGRVDDIGAVDEANAHARDGAIEGDIGDVDRRAGRDDADDVGGDYPVE